MKMRNPLTLVQIAFLTLAAVIAADLIAVMLQWSWTAPPPTAVTARPPTRGAVPASVDQVVADTRSLLKDAPAPVASPAASPGPGEGPGSPGGPGGTEAAPPDPSQTMILLGTLVSPGASAAFIQIAGNTTTAYEGGIINGYRVVEIRSSSVLLAYGSTEVPLYLPSLIPPKTPPQAGALPPPPAPVVVQSNTVPAPGDPGKVVLARSDVSATLQKPDEYMKQMRILPYNKDGKPYGMRVMYLQPGSMLNRMGVQAGDIMLNVNGSNLYSVSDAMNAYQTIEKEDHVAFQVERQGKPITLEVDIR